MDQWLDEYRKLLEGQEFDEQDLDYSLLNKHREVLSLVAGMSNSGITIFDTYKREHVFTSDNFEELFGENDNGKVDARIHPDDLKILNRNGVEALRYLSSHKEEVKNYKMVSEFRIRNAAGVYVRAVEQYSVLELDKKGNVWLSLSMLDVSPDQDIFQPVKTHLLNVKDNSIVSILELYAEHQEFELTPQELKILQLIKEGFLSKEISEQLFISKHTVNTHRQRILKKLDVANSMEAVKKASSLGFLR